MPDRVPIDVVEAARKGSVADIERLLCAAWPDAYRLAFGVLGDRTSAEDAAQEACVLLYRTIASLRDALAFRTWFYRIVVREASSIKRKRASAECSIESSSYDPDPATSIDIWRALTFLPLGLREVVVLRYFEDLPTREIAAILRIHDGAVRFRLMKARHRLRRLLGDVFENATGTISEVKTSAI